MSKKLYEILAVEGDLEGVYKKTLEKTSKVFTDEVNMFFGAVRTVEWFEEGHPPQPAEYQELTKTVSGELLQQKKAVIRYFDVWLQKERTNQEAFADIIIEGNVIVHNLPATFLLGLENRLRKIKDVYMKIPTLPPSVKWEEDTTKGKGIYRRVNPEEVLKTEKIFKVQVLYEATKEHPAQVDKISETKSIGIKRKEVWTSVLAPAEKISLIEKINKLLLAVKQARQRANSATVVGDTVGEELFDYINS